MPEPTPVPPPQDSPPKPPARPTIHIGEEFGTAKKNLPPGKIVVIAIILVGIVVAFSAFLKRAKPQASGTLDNVVAIEVPGQNSTMVALTFTLRNTSDKALYVREIQSSIKTSSGEAKADALSAVDFERYFQAFPDLKNGSQPALLPETEMAPGTSLNRTILVGYPIPLDAFNHRQSVSVIVWPYNETVPVVMTK